MQTLPPPSSPTIGPRIGPVVLLPILEKINEYIADSDVINEDEKYEFSYEEYVRLQTLESGTITGSPGDIHHLVGYVIDNARYDFDSFTPYKTLIGKFEDGTISREEFLPLAQELLKSTKKQNDESNYTVYVTVRDFKQSAWFSSVDQPLFYTGITTDENERYLTSEVQSEYFEPVAQDVSKDVARGTEQLLIELNNSGQPYPASSDTLDNYRNSTSPFRLEYYTRKLAGLLYLEQNIPDWKTEYLRPPESIKTRIGKR